MYHALSPKNIAVIMMKQPSRSLHRALPFWLSVKTLLMSFPMLSCFSLKTLLQGQNFAVHEKLDKIQPNSHINANVAKVDEAFIVLTEYRKQYT